MWQGLALRNNNIIYQDFFEGFDARFLSTEAPLKTCTMGAIDPLKITYYAGRIRKRALTALPRTESNLSVLSVLLAVSVVMDKRTPIYLIWVNESL